MAEIFSLFDANVHCHGNFIKIQDVTSGEHIFLAGTNLGDLEISYLDDFNVFGVAKFTDFGFEKYLNVSNDIHVIVYQKDPFKTEFFKEFVVTNFKRTRENNNNIITLYFRDLISYYLDRRFITKSYDKIKLSKIIKDTIESDEIFGKFKENRAKPKLEFDETLDFERFVVTPNISFLQFIRKELKRQGFILFQDRGTIKLKNVKEIKPEKIENIFRDKVGHGGRYYHYQIYQYNVRDVSNDTQRAKTQTIAYDPSNKTMKVYGQNLDDSGLKKSKDNPQKTIGIQYNAQEYLNDNNLYNETYQSFIKTNLMDLVIPGNLTDISKFKLLNIQLAGNASFKELRELGDEKNSGEYICLGYIDKLLFNRYFITYTKVSRFNKTEIS